MKIVFHKNFVRRYKKLRLNEKQRFKERRDIFLINPLDPILNNHLLHGKYAGYRSINIIGNLRVIYKLLKNDTVVFAEIDSHSNLYS